jgi:hypothetical protein
MNNSLTATNPKAIVALVCSFFLVSSGCTTTRSYTSADAVQDELRRGDDVTVVLKDGRELELTVTKWTGDRLEGLDRAGVAHSVASPDITRLDITRKAPVKTTLLLLAVSGVVLGAMAASLYGDFLSDPFVL